ncbi:helix-turn-helix transcriptional regulator [Paenibacillus bovis]|uniref:DNA-binding protein n=1 Tax=Paenibacillus bovis TaxID=1616788 RepID=A0A172ZBG9_9BACL|nr:helix-turn-helix transcriptional regulator [Paenibacillus bovis]ANF94994.1 DNA-binding protein [Paenibacillus bovis]
MKKEHSSPLGEFIKSRRERLQPDQAGIQPLPGRRRTPGLRREEVAYLANMSVTYYTWLEQGRETRPSPEVLSSISTALQLSTDEHRYLLDLARNGSVDHTDTAEEAPSDTGFLQNIVDQLHYPSFITDEGTDVIAWNRAAELCIADFGSLSQQDRHMSHVIFFDEDYRRRLLNWEEFARYSVAIMRTRFEDYQKHPLYRDRFERLLQDSDVFASLWAKYEIQQKRVKTAYYQLEDGQIMEFDIHYTSVIDNDPGLHWCFFVPVPGSGTEERLLQRLEQDRQQQL